MGKKRKQWIKYIVCNKCQLERINNRAEGCLLCIKCGNCEFCLFPSVNDRDMPSVRICHYFHKKNKPLKVRLRRFQTVESENLPEKVYDIIKRDLRKKRLRGDGVFTTGPMPNLTNLMKILNNNKLTKYYNNIQQIYCGVTGIASPTLTRKEEEKIIEIFQEVERSYRKYINRYIFLAIHMYKQNIKNFEKGRTWKYFKLLKCRWKLKEYDNIWRNICIEKGWDFYSSLYYRWKYQIMLRKKQLMISNNYMTICQTDVLGC